MHPAFLCVDEISRHETLYKVQRSAGKTTTVHNICEDISHDLPLTITG